MYITQQIVVKYIILFTTARTIKAIDLSSLECEAKVEIWQ